MAGSYIDGEDLHIATISERKKQTWLDIYSASDYTDIEREEKKMLILPIKKKWFDMIASGEKKEEYREMKPYYTTRFHASGLYEENINECILRNGYSKKSPSI